MGWLAALFSLPIAAWAEARHLLITQFDYVPPPDLHYLANPYLSGTVAVSAGTVPSESVDCCAVHSSSGLAPRGFSRGARRLGPTGGCGRSLQPRCRPWCSPVLPLPRNRTTPSALSYAVLIPPPSMPALPAGLVAALLIASAALTVRMSAAVSWLRACALLTIIAHRLFGVGTPQTPAHFPPTGSIEWPPTRATRWKGRRHDRRHPRSLPRLGHRRHPGDRAATVCARHSAAVAAPSRSCSWKAARMACRGWP